MWIVTCDIKKGVLWYYVENKVTGERRGTFDCEQWAEREANRLNEQTDSD